MRNLFFSLAFLLALGIVTTPIPTPDQQPAVAYVDVGVGE